MTKRTGSLPGLMLALVALNAAAADARVEVTFGDLAKFSDLRLSRPTSERETRGLADQLKKYLEERAPRRLPGDTRLAVTITDVDMAGEFRPVGGGGQPDLRVVKDVYPPRVDLEFKLLRADGSVEREGRRQLRDAMFLASGGLGSRDVLGYEKALLDHWLEREFARKP